MSFARFFRSAAAFFFLASLVSGCVVDPSLRYGFVPSPPLTAMVVAQDESKKDLGQETLSPAESVCGKIIVMKPLDKRGHAGTTPGIKAYIPLYPYVMQIREPEAFTYEWNGSRYDYELDFAELVAMDLRSSGLASDVQVSQSNSVIPKSSGDVRILRLTLSRLEWQRKFTMYGISVLGYLPQAFGAPDEYGYSYLEYSAELLDSNGKPLAKRKFSAVESRNGWLYYFTGFLRGLTDAYAKTSPDLRNFIYENMKRTQTGE